MSAAVLLRADTQASSGCLLRVDGATSGLRSTGLAFYRLEVGERLAWSSAEHEACVVLFSGRADVQAGDSAWADVGARQQLFDGGKPHALYLSLNTSLSLVARTPLELAICTAPGRLQRPPRLITPAQVTLDERGEGVCRRRVHKILWEQDEADSLLITEVFTPAGHWSSYPPHKHDRDAPPEESSLEEIYFFKIDPPQGFALQRVYSDEGEDQCFSPGNNDAVTVPRGYHPVAAPPDYQVYYLNVMAGTSRQWHIYYDPRTPAKPA
ncbi:5-deoxy-glucuronate isomerase [Pseudomonas paeninsulae]|uniref:5-deoxy-glucuronate isomerase n=1 Tax=Pseudomonas paeninsulae TaxID=3110772 RepID=UPI002D7A0C13|nr:5-deoxy-glucuronate isomerase [Pseudomonas sp. IT1137]